MGCRHSRRYPAITCNVHHRNNFRIVLPYTNPDEIFQFSMTRLLRKLISLFGIGALLFAQLAVSAYACPMQFTALDDATVTMVACEKNASVRDMASPALCQQHCENGQKNVNDTPQTPTFFAVETGLVVTRLTESFLPIEAAGLSPSLLHATSPPVSIRNCCFRI